MNKCVSRKLSKNKVFELEMSTQWYVDYFNLSFQWTRRQDHAGPAFTFECLKFYFCVKIYDIRHWDDKTNSYQE